METIQYRSIDDMTKLILNRIDDFRNLECDLIVGIPRSGMIPAALIALFLNKPFCDIDTFLDDKMFSSGHRFKNLVIKNKKVLVIDDSISSGAAINEVKNKLKCKTDWTIVYAAIYARQKSTNMIDFYGELVEGDRVFEWNMFQHANILNMTCMDIDGVLCENPPIDDDGPLYHEYLISAKPKFLPNVKIKTLISCRLEKYRPETVFG